MTLFLAARPPLFCSYDPLLGWDKFAGRVQAVRVGGDHASIMREPHVSRLADAPSPAVV